jgi:hypothetical protein
MTIDTFDLYQSSVSKRLALVQTRSLGYQATASSQAASAESATDLPSFARRERMLRQRKREREEQDEIWGKQPD